MFNDWLKKEDTINKFDVDFVVTIRGRENLKKYNAALNLTTLKATQLLRANHGGGMPCPDQVCSAPSIFDYF